MEISALKESKKSVDKRKKKSKHRQKENLNTEKQLSKVFNSEIKTGEMIGNDSKNNRKKLILFKTNKNLLIGYFYTKIR